MIYEVKTPKGISKHILKSDRDLKRIADATKEPILNLGIFGKVQNTACHIRLDLN